LAESAPQSYSAARHTIDRRRGRPGGLLLFAIIAEDKPGSRDIRLATRAAHLEYLQSFGGQSSGTRIVVAGPLLGPDGESMTGSLLIIEAADRPAAESFAGKLIAESP
jgi:uncharacterized protein YciI